MTTPIQPSVFRTLLTMAVAAAVLSGSAAYANDPPPVIVGKKDWLFYRYELSDATDAPMIEASLDLIRRFNGVLAANGITMALALVPLKMRIYAEHLPDDIKFSDAMRANHERIDKALQAAHVNVIDLNAVFLGSPRRIGDTPLYFRLDTHWAPAGALLAAESIKSGIDNLPALKKARDATPEEGFKIIIGKNKINAVARDLVDQLPKPAPVYAPEATFAFDVNRAAPAAADLLGHRAAPGITLVGSSYSSDWTGFPNALRHALQRDVLSVAVGADQGSWVGIESYLRNDAFQATPPKLLIWEMPERDMRAPPNYRYREPRYLIDNTEWLLRASAWVQAVCKPSTVRAKLTRTGLAATEANLKSGGIVSGATSDSDFVEYSFDKPLDRLDYLAARASAAGSRTITLEASGPGVAARRFTLPVPGDGAAHALKSPLPSNGNGYATVRIYPGKSSGFALQDLKICRQPDNLLK